MKTQDLPLQNARGLARQAQISAPDGDTFASALFIHELPEQAADHIVEALTRRGVAVASLAAQQATEESPLGGDDLIALRDALQSQIEGGPQLLIGHGLPGTLLLVRAEDMPSARAMALIHAPSSETRTMRLMETSAGRSGSRKTARAPGRTPARRAHTI